MLGQLPTRYRFPRNAPPYEDAKTSFMFLSGSFDTGVLAQMAAAVNGGCLGWVVIPVTEHAFRAIRRAGPLLMHLDLSSIGMWGIGL